MKTWLYPFVLFLVGKAALSAQPYNFVAYSLAEGLPQSQVFAMCRDSRGYLWLGTQGGGLSRFDGLRFQTFTVAEGLPSNYIGALAEDEQQRLWIGTDKGLCRFDGRRFEPVHGFGGDDAAEVYALAHVAPASVWIGTDRGLFFCPTGGARARPVSVPGQSAPLIITALLPSAKGVWVGTNRGAWLIGAQSARLTERQGLPGNTVYAFARDSAHRLWIGSMGGLAVLDENNMRVVQRFLDPALGKPLSLQTGNGGNMWVGTYNNGLFCYSPADSSWTALTERDGLPHQHVHCLLRDPAGPLWIGTSGGGLAKLAAQPFRHFDQSRGLAGNRVYALHEDRAGRLWVGVSQNGLQVLDSSGFHAFGRDSGYLQIKCKTIAEDESGNLWVGTEGKGIAIFDSAGMHRLTREQGLPSDLVQKIIPGPGGAMWVATLAGGIARVSRAVDGSFVIKKFGIAEGLPDLQIQTLRNDKAGNIWFSTQAGQVGFLKDEQPGAVFDKKNGLPGTPVRALAIDAQGRVWAGTKGAGIYWADPAAKNPHFNPLDASLRSHSPNIYLLSFDAAGNLWAGSETGVDKIAFNATGTTASAVEHFGKNEGFLGIETCHDAVLEDHLGQLWFGTMNGLTRYVPTNWTQTPAAPALHFESISLFYKPLAETAFAGWVLPGGGLRDGLELPHHQNHLSFAFRAVDLHDPEHIRYRWRLEGAETEWSPLSMQEQVNYANLAPGAYTFQVQATTDGETFSAPVAAAFVIRRPVWQLWWFQVLAVLVLLLLTGLGAYAWVRRIRGIEQARREKLEVENRLLQLEQKALQLQMNPHFIFNALTSIQALITERDYPQARQEINHFAQLMRGILANSRRQTINLQEEVNTLDQYLRIEQFCHQQKFTYVIELPTGVDPDEVALPPMLLQPFIENAVVHGVSPLPYPGHIRVRFSLEDELLCCEITDNGIGRERAARLREEKKPGHQSAALQVTQERLEALRAGRPYVSLEISDVVDDKGEIAGTRVVVRLPAAMEF